MTPLRYLVPAALRLSAHVLGANLLASHYTGKIYSLLYGSNGSLAVTGSATGCGLLPAWLHLDPESKTVYSVDESWYGSGLLASYTVDTNGVLTQTGSLATKGASVHGTPYGGENGACDPSTLTTYELPLTEGASVLQMLQFNMSAPGPNPRQNAPHPHSTVLDPTGKFIVVPDLGADLIRVFSIDSATGNLTACAPGVADPGDGPRHAAWWAPSVDSTAGQMLYTVNELGNSVSAWAVSYPDDGCLALTKQQTLSTYAAGTTPPDGSKAAEVHVAGDFLYAANRADQTFGAEQDSLATYAIDAASGAISWVEATNAHAWFPRTFSINAAGDLVAVGGQTSSNVAIISRNPATGRLGGLVASVLVATPGTEQQEDGLSAVIWVE
ncbi:Uu.00g051250.m01.CDS01 [Anthostomella pinea]|uniref:Uu.00g051250.m01.CDS01 n=1 Tax=Anthostomella pinea TaxID=933095 RepID=A0AAI8VU00_9PEZI|nr:Uu.00g051250.m01.CDS01 [Anthostomella pinea]